jgi:hypothetical protein
VYAKEPDADAQWHSAAFDSGKTSKPSSEIMEMFSPGIVISRYQKLLPILQEHAQYQQQIALFRSQRCITHHQQHHRRSGQQGNPLEMLRYFVTTHPI